MDKCFINFRYIGKYTNRLVVSFSCRFALRTCRDDFNSFKTFPKPTNVETIIIVITYNWRLSYNWRLETSADLV